MTFFVPELMAEVEEDEDKGDKEPEDPTQEGEEFTDTKHESAFSLETNFIDADMEDHKDRPASPSVVTSAGIFAFFIQICSWLVNTIYSACMYFLFYF